MKNLCINVDTEESFVSSYLRFFKGILDLTDTEVLILVRFIIVDRRLIVDGEDERIIYSRLFSVEVKDMIREDISYSSFNNHLKSLRDKGCFQFRPDGSFIVNSTLIPSTELVIKFELE